MAERRDRAGRVELITELVNLQRALANVSAKVATARYNAVENHAVQLSEENYTRLINARTMALDVADQLHAVASELVGELKKETGA